MKKIIGVLFAWGLAVFAFWQIFFNFSPWVVSLLPMESLGDMYGLAKLAVYAIVAYIGGIGIPLAIGIWGTVIALAIFD